MAKRYFKATDGKRTYFRASPTRVYLSATIDPTVFNGFILHRDARGRFPVAEITGAEYRQLITAKQKRAALEGVRSDAPCDSWIENGVDYDYEARVEEAR